jgi:hypothetical protein
MKSKRSTHRSFPGRLTLEEWIALPGLGRRDLIDRAGCELLACHQLCAGKDCQRHRTCCGDNAAACKERLWRLANWHPMTLRREIGRLGTLAWLGEGGRETSQGAAKSLRWTSALHEPWNAPEVFPGWARERP